MKKYLIIIGAAISAFLAVLLKVFNLGRNEERSKQKQDDLKAAETRVEVDHEVDQSGDDSVRSRLSKWVHDE
ncbi:hypothetical protein BAnh1_09930 [Bartonella australis AUST/NH1]|uniref:Uncharacterized protein n=1 Tax=Bartonella australis (strain Aust/NH1) TaxID=1094489 RepID=M1NU82_BARAA|nr:hypothetical protein [Bartonella australis]AGF74863.1 hypothetical protein BAnh1_09930 [Bartonella australis AUST/NH1]